MSSSGRFCKVDGRRGSGCGAERCGVWGVWGSETNIDTNGHTHTHTHAQAHTGTDTPKDTRTGSGSGSDTQGTDTDTSHTTAPAENALFRIARSIRLSFPAHRCAVRGDGWVRGLEFGGWGAGCRV